MKNEEKTTDNEHIGEIAAVAPQKRQYELGSYYPTQATLSSYAAKLRYPAPQGGRKGVPSQNMKVVPAQSEMAVASGNGIAS